MAVQVQGARELESTMHHAASDLGDMAQSHTRAAQYLAQTARGLAPRKSGRLAGSIRAQAAATGATVTAGGPGVPYAGPIHWGWPARNIAAQPFLTDALAQAETSALGIYSNQVNQTISQIHGK